MHPFVKYIASASSDATMRVYKNRKLKNQLQFFHKFTVKQREENEEQTFTEIIQNNIPPKSNVRLETEI
jgi:hypothetical protein